MKNGKMVNGSKSDIVQGLQLTMEWIKDGNGYSGANINDVFNIQHSGFGFGRETFNGYANIGGINVGYYVAAIYNDSTPMDDNNELDYVGEPDFLSNGSVWVTIYDSSSMNSGAAAVAILKYGSVADYQHFWGN